MCIRDSNYTMTGGLSTNQMKQYTVTVTGAAVGDPVIVNFRPNTVKANKFGIVSAWVHQANKVRFYARGYGWFSNTTYVQVTVIK